MNDRVLLAWEQGRNLGHLSRLSAVASALEQRGCSVHWVLPQSHLRHAQLEKFRHLRTAAPAAPASVGASGRPDSFADILLSLGFGSPGLLFNLVQQWFEIFRKVRPARVLVDYAPVAQLAACLAGIKAFQISNGFATPPPHCPVFGITVRGPYLERKNAQKLERLNESISLVSRRVAAAAPADLASCFGSTEKFFDCIAETDPYPARESANYLGPIGAPPDVVDVRWDNSYDAPASRVLMYMRGAEAPIALLNALAASGCSTIAVCPDVDDSLADALTRWENLRLFRQPVNVSQLWPETSAVINYGPAGFVCASALMGKPQMMIPLDVEKHLIAQKIVEREAGFIWQPRREAADAAVHRLLHTPLLSDAAAGIARRYSSSDLSIRKQHFFAKLAGTDA